MLSEQDRSFFDLSVLSYNLYAGDDFRHARIPFMVQEILAKEPDVLCLQECTQAVVDALASKDERYQVAWSKTAATEEQYAGSVGGSDPPQRQEHGVLNSVAEQLGWKRLDDLSGLGSGKCPEASLELSELFLMVNTETVDVIERELIHIGNWFDDGMMRVRVVNKRPLVGTAPAVVEAQGSPEFLRDSELRPAVDVFNIHFCGGSFGKLPEVLLKKRSAREAEFRILNASVAKSLPLKGEENGVQNPPAAVIIAGDFNCDPAFLDLFPECALSPEAAMDLEFVDVAKDLGPTESTSKNLFRKWLKPGQDREARFDRVLACGGSFGNGNNLSVEVLSAELIGDQQVGTAACFTSSVPSLPPPEIVPLFPSDHFGVLAKLRIHACCRG